MRASGLIGRVGFSFILFGSGLLNWLLSKRGGAAPGVPQSPLTAQQQRADFEQMCEFIDTHYCYFAEKATDWEAVVKHYRPLAASATSRGQFVRVLESVLDELYDPHTHLGVNLADSWRLPPYDLWAEWRDGRAQVLEVRSDSPAARAGIHAGWTISEIDGQDIAAAVASRQPRFLRYADKAADNWALVVAISGRHDRPRDLKLFDKEGSVHTVHLDNDFTTPLPEPMVSCCCLAPGLAYIRISSFANEAVVPAFDQALKAQRGARGMLIDVRNNSGGDTQVTRPVMGRLIRRRVQYAWMSRRKGPGMGRLWREYIKPRGPWAYTGPLVVLVNHWTMSAAEGFAAGLENVGRATVVGTRMAGLGAGIRRVTLNHSRIPVQISAEPVFQLNERPRSRFGPNVEIDLTTALCTETVDTPLIEGLAVLQKRITQTPIGFGYAADAAHQYPSEHVLLPPRHQDHDAEV